MDKATKERLNILAGVSTIEFFVRSKALDLVDSVSKIHPMMKVYFDSELNSDIENNALLAMSEALIWSVETFTEKGPMSNFRSIGVSIAQTLSKRMYFAKLIHHANTGRITIEQFYEYASEYIAAESVNVINQLWDVIGAELPQYLSAGIQKVLEFFDVDPQTAEWIAGLIDSAINVAYSYVKKFLTQEKIQEFVYQAIKFIIESSRKLFSLIDETVETAKDLFHKAENKIKSWGRSICSLFNWNIPDFLKETEKEDVFSDDVDVNNVDTNEVNASGINVDDVSIDTVNADNMNIGDVNIEDVSIDTANVGDVNIEDVNIDAGIQVRKDDVDKKKNKKNVDVIK